ncbi:Cerato-platanin-domain-containing protein [Russula vinacea]|nr:Cerato-platanin-domain-containing protein [Russula vinacea]
MIYFTTFIFALFLSQIARALPQVCGDAVPPESPTPVKQFNIPIASHTVVTHDPKYGNPFGSMKSVACWNVVLPVRWFHDIPTFPAIGGAFDIDHSPGPNCGTCWRLHNSENNHSIIMTAIDHADHGFVLSDETFKLLNGGNLVPELKHVDYFRVPARECGL